MGKLVSSHVQNDALLYFPYWEGWTWGGGGGGGAGLSPPYIILTACQLHNQVINSRARK